MTPSSSVVSASEPTRPSAAARPRPLQLIGDFFRRNTRRVGWGTWVTDSLLAVFVSVLFGFPTLMTAAGWVWFEPELVVPGVCYAAALVIRRWAPGMALTITFVAILLKFVMELDPHGQDIAIAIVIYSCAAYGNRRTLIGSAVFAVVLPALYLATFAVHRPRSMGWSSIAVFLEDGIGSFLVFAGIVWFLGAVALSMCWLAGLLRRMQRDARIARSRREVAEVESLRSREQLFVEQERNRIARDMHDVVAHTLAVVVAQADGGRYAMRANPAAGEETLTKIAEISREALVEVRGLLGQLRHSQPEGPQPGFADAPVVLERMRLAGLPIVVESSGTPAPLGQNADIALYRLVQESLTNSLRHGDRTRPTVIRISWTAELRVEVENVVNPVPPPPRADSGHGLIGMRERLVLSGGSLEAGRVGDVFRIVAVVPTAGSATPPAPTTEADDAVDARPDVDVPPPAEPPSGDLGVWGAVSRPPTDAIPVDRTAAAPAAPAERGGSPVTSADPPDADAPPTVR